MKTRVRLARYQDVMHIEMLLQEAIETADIPLPVIERPHIFNVLNFHIPRGEVILAIVDEKMAGVALLKPQTFMWNTEAYVYNGSAVVRQPFLGQGVEQALIAAMVSYAAQKEARLFYAKDPGFRSDIEIDELASMGATITNGMAVFLVPERMENDDE